MKATSATMSNSQKGPEEYEKNVPSMKTFFRGIKGETLFIVGGSGTCLSNVLENNGTNKR